MGLEGYYWRFAGADWSVCAIAGVCRDARGTWAMVTLASEPDGFEETRIVDAAGAVGESDPAQAIDDALATFAADRLVIVTHPEGHRDYREDEALTDAESRWNIPVSRAEINRG